MIFVYNKKAGNKTLEIEGENFNHLFNSRRTRLGEVISFRNLKEPFDFIYRVVKIGKKKALLEFIKKEKIEKKLKRKKLHLG